MDTVDLSDTSLGGTVLQCRRGDAFTFNILGELDNNNALHNLGGYGPTWTSQLRVQASDPDFVVAFAVNAANINGAVSNAQDAPQLTLSLTGTQTAALAPGMYVFDVQVTGGSVSPYTPYQGRLRITADVTRA